MHPASREREGEMSDNVSHSKADPQIPAASSTAPPRVWISAITFKGGTRIELGRDDVAEPLERGGDAGQVVGVELEREPDAVRVHFVLRHDGANDFGVVFLDVAADLGERVVALFHAEYDDAALAAGGLLAKSGQRIGDGDNSGVLVPLIDHGH